MSDWESDSSSLELVSVSVVSFELLFYSMNLIFLLSVATFKEAVLESAPPPRFYTRGSLPSKFYIVLLFLTIYVSMIIIL